MSRSYSEGVVKLAKKFINAEVRGAKTIGYKTGLLDKPTNIARSNPPHLGPARPGVSLKYRKIAEDDMVDTQVRPKFKQLNKKKGTK